MIIRNIVFLFATFAANAHAHPPELLSDPPDGTPTSEPEKRATFRPAIVEETTTHQQSDRTIIVQRLALDPNDPIQPVVKREEQVLPAADQPTEPESTEPYETQHLLVLSATVYPGPVTRLVWTHNFKDGTRHEYSAWSNIDFCHLSGISTFLGTDGQPHTFIMGVGTEETAPENPPTFTTTAPTFLPDQANIPAEATITIDSLHKLYAIEHEKLAAAHAGRQQAQAAHEAELLANPPQPKDLIIRYRIAETPLE